MRRSARIDPQDLTIRVREAMKQPASYEPAWRACLSYDWRSRIDGLPITYIAAREDVFAHLTPAATLVDDTPQARAAAIRR